MGTVKGEQMEEVVTVGSKKELEELLMSSGKWTSDEFSFHDKTYCYFDENESGNPFIFVDEDGVESVMNGAWNIKTWRKVKPRSRFKKYDVVMCWFKERKNALIDVWNETGVFYGTEDEDVYFDNYEPYTGPVPKHIQDFIDEMKAKENQDGNQ